jgi:prepilin-type N-terminal cleavage/methylation domain-containing protein
MRGVFERGHRRGMTLVEIMVSLVLLGIVSGVIMRVIMRQQRFYQGVNQIMTQRSQLRQATAVLPVDLRSLSSIGDDILVATDSSIEFNVNVGTGAVCAIVDTKNRVAMPPDTLDSGQDITSWFGYPEPKPDDDDVAYSVYIYDDSVTLGNEDDYWKRYKLDKIHHDGAQCLTTYTTIGDAGKLRPILEVSDPDGFVDPVTGGPLSQYIGIGAPVRVTRQVKYDLYKETDGKWYLGFARYLKTNAYEAPSPVSGPYDPYGSAPGVAFRYYDVDGNEIASGADRDTRRKIARIDLIVRARTAANVRAAGIQGGLNQQYRDSLAVSVMLRNRR